LQNQSDEAHRAHKSIQGTSTSYFLSVFTCLALFYFILDRVGVILAILADDRTLADRVRAMILGSLAKLLGLNNEL
jgi:hypothetical protein